MLLNMLTFNKGEPLNDTTLVKAKDEEGFKRLIVSNKTKLYRIGKGILKYSTTILKIFWRGKSKSKAI